MNERFPLAMLFPLRLLIAVILVIEGFQKLKGGWFHGDGLARITQGWLDNQRAYPFFLPILQSAHAHPKIFGTLITLGELFVGAGLAVGFATRLVSFLGVLLLGSIACAGGQGLAPPGNAVLMAAICAIFVLAPPGRFLGLDQALRARLPRWMT